MFSGREERTSSHSIHEEACPAIAYIMLPQQSVLNNPIKVAFPAPNTPSKKRQTPSSLSPLGTADDVVRCGLRQGLNLLQRSNPGDGTKTSIQLSSDCFDQDHDEDDAQEVIIISIKELGEEGSSHGSSQPYNSFKSHHYHVTISTQGEDTRELKSGEFFSIGEIEGRIFFPCVLEQETSWASSAIYQPSKPHIDLRGHRPHKWDSTDGMDSTDHAPYPKRPSNTKDSISDIKIYYPPGSCDSAHCTDQRKSLERRQSWEPRYSEESDESVPHPLPPLLSPPPPPPPQHSLDISTNGGVFTWVSSRRIAEGGIFDGFERANMMRTAGFSFMVPLTTQPSASRPISEKDKSFDDALGLLQLSPDH